METNRRAPAYARGKQRAGKSERVQLPTGNGKQTKWGKRGKEIREQVGKEERERVKEKRGKERSEDVRGKTRREKRWNRRNAMTRMLHQANEEDEDAAVGG